MQGMGTFFSQILQTSPSPWNGFIFTIMPAGLSTEITLEVKCFVEIFFLKFSSFLFLDVYVHVIVLIDLAGRCWTQEFLGTTRSQMLNC